MSVSIIVPTYYRDRELFRCLRAIEAQCTDGVEVIVCDDAGDVSLARHLRELFPFTRYVRGPSRGPAANRNAGARLARGEVLIFVDDDCIPEAGWLSSFVSVFSNPQVTIVQGRVVGDRKPLSALEWAPLVESGRTFVTCNVGIRASVFSTLGGFDEDFETAAMEDIDFAVRASKHAFYVTFCPEAKVTHPLRIINAQREFRIKLRGCRTFLAKHPESCFRDPWWSAKALIASTASTTRTVLGVKGRGASIILWQIWFRLAMLMLAIKMRITARKT